MYETQRIAELLRRARAHGHITFAHHPAELPRYKGPNAL